MQVENFQRDAWRRFFTDDIYKVCENNSFETADLAVSYRPVNNNVFVKIRKAHELGRDSMQENFLIDVTIESKNPDSDARSAEYKNVPIAVLPLLTTSGFCIKGSFYTAINQTTLASGWYIEREGDKVNLIHRSRFGKNLRVMYSGKNNMFTVQLMLQKTQNNKPIGLFPFLKALNSSKSYADILNDFNGLDIFTKAYFSDRRAQQKKDKQSGKRSVGFNEELYAVSEPSTDECAELVFKTMHPYNKTERDFIGAVHNEFFVNNRLRVGKDRISRFRELCSFSNGLRCVLAEDVKVPKRFHYKKGTILTSQIISNLNSANVDHIYIVKNNSKFKLVRPDIQDNLTIEEITTAIYYYGLYLEGIGEITDQDSASNKITRTIGAMMGDFVSKKLAALSDKIISNYTAEAIYGLTRAIKNTDIQAIQKKEKIESVIFEDSQYCQSEETNSLAAVQQNFKNTASSSELGKNARAFKPSQINRLCPYTTPESSSVGANTSLTFGAGVNNEGFMTFPAYEVKGGVRTDISVEVTAEMEQDAVIAPYDAELDEPFTGNPVIANCQLNGELISAPRREIKYQLVSQLQVMSPMLLMVVSANRNAGKRLTMAANALNQSLPPVKRERPFVVTGMELLLKPNVVTAREILTSALQELSLDITHIPEDTRLTLVEVRDPLPDKEYSVGSYGTFVTFATNLKEIPRFTHTLNRLQPVTGSPTMKHQRIRFKPDSRDYSLDEVVVINNDTDDREWNLQTDKLKFGRTEVSTEPMKDTALAIGCNVRVLYKSQEGCVYEDAVLVRKGFAIMYGLAVASLYRIKDKSDKNTKFTNDLASMKNRSSTGTQYLNGRGLPAIGTQLRPGQVAIGKRKVNVGSRSDGKNINKSTMIPVGESGVVINTYITSEYTGDETIETANVVLGEVRFLEVGDKVTGTHGNKGVVVKIIDDEDLPICDGYVPDIILGPLGPIARTNIGQLIEAILGAIGREKNETQFLVPFDKMTVSDMIKNAEKVGLKEVDVYDGRTGRKYERKSFLGTMYFLRSKHTSTSKHNAGGLSGYDRNLVTNEGGRGQLQRTGELFLSALRANDATETVKYFCSGGSNDSEAQEQYISAIKAKTSLDGIDSTPRGVDTFLAFVRPLGLNIYVNGDTKKLIPLTDADIQKISLQHITTGMLGSLEEDVNARSFLRSKDWMKKFYQADYYTKIDRVAYSDVELPEPLIMPLMCYGPSFLNMFVVSVDNKLKLMSCQVFKDILWNGTILYDSEFKLIPELYTAKYMKANNMRNQNHLQGADALMCIFRRYDLRVTVKILEDLIGPVMENDPKYHFTRYSDSYKELSEVNIDLTEFDSSKDTSTDDMPAKEDILSDKFIEAALADADIEAAGEEITEIVDKLKNPDAKQEDKSEEYAEPADLADIENVKLDNNYDFNRLLSVRATVLAFMKNHTMDEYFVHSIVIPPIGFRPDFDGNLASPIDKQLEDVISNIRAYLINKNTNSFTQIYRSLFNMIVRNPKMSNKDKTVFEALTDHKNKNSIIRDNLCAHRVIASGRSVITVNPNLSIDECRVPLSITTTLLFEWLKADAPTHFTTLIENLQKVYGSVSSDIYKSVFDCLSNDNISGFKRLLRLNDCDFKNLWRMFHDCKQELIDRENYYLSKYPVLLNREPSLKKFNVQAFMGQITEGYAIEISPLCCRGYNADFDGDQMAVFLMFLPKVVEEAKRKLIAHMNLINPDNGELMAEINQDMILGLYWMTMLPSNVTSIKNPCISKFYDLDAHFIDNLGADGFGSTEVYHDTYDRYKNTRFIQIWDDINANLITPQEFVVVKYNNNRYIGTVGRILFNSLFPEGTGFIPSMNGETWGKLKYDMLIAKGSIKKVLQSTGKYFREGAQKQYEEEYQRSGEHTDEFEIFSANNKQYADFLDRLKDIGFFMADMSNVSISVYDFRRLEIARTNNAISDTLRKMMYNAIGADHQFNRDVVLNVLNEIRFLIDWCNETSAENYTNVFNTEYLNVVLNDNMHTAQSPVKVLDHPEYGTLSIGHAIICSILGKHVPCSVEGIVDALEELASVDSANVFNTTVKIVNSLVDFANKSMIEIEPHMSDSVKEIRSKTGVSEITHRREVLNRKLNAGRLTRERFNELSVGLTDETKKLIQGDIESTMNKSRNSNLFLMVDSGARGNTSQLLEVCGVIGSVTDSNGSTLSTPIMGNLLNGLTPSEMTLSAYAARSTLVDTQLNIPVTGTLNRDLSYYTQHLEIRPEHDEPEDFCGAKPIKYALTWEASVPDISSSNCRIYTGFDVEMKDNDRWQRFLHMFYNKNSAVKYNSKIQEAASKVGLTHLFVVDHGNVNVKNISRVTDKDLIYVGWTIEFIRSADLKRAYRDFVTYYHTTYNNEHILNNDVLEMLTTEFIDEIPVVVDNSHKMVKVKYTLAKHTRNTLLYRSIGYDDLEPEYKALVDKYAFKKYADGHLIAYIVNNDFMDALTKCESKLRFFPIYTITACKSLNGICRRCYGMKYDTDMMPKPGELIGFQGVQAVCSTMSQMILDSHKSKSSGAALAQYGQLVRLLSECCDVKERMTQELTRVFDKVIKDVGVNIDRHTVKAEFLRTFSTTALPGVIKDTDSVIDMLMDFLKLNQDLQLHKDTIQSKYRILAGIGSILRGLDANTNLFEDSELQEYVMTLFDIQMFNTCMTRRITELTDMISRAFGNTLNDQRTHIICDMISTAYRRWFDGFNLSSASDINSSDFRMKFRNQVMSQIFDILDQKCFALVGESLVQYPELENSIVAEAVSEINSSIKLYSIPGAEPIEAIGLDDLASSFKTDLMVPWFDIDTEVKDEKHAAFRDEFEIRVRDVITTSEETNLKVVRNWIMSEAERIHRSGEVRETNVLVSQVYNDIEQKSNSEDMGLYLKLSVWYDLINQLKSSGILSRNFEPLSLALNAVGECLEDKIGEDGTVFAVGETYPTLLLRRNGVAYSPIKVDRDQVPEKSGTVFACMALSHTRDHITTSVTKSENNLYNDQICEAITGGEYVTTRPHISVAAATDAVDLNSILSESYDKYESVLVDGESVDDVSGIEEVQESIASMDDDFMSELTMDTQDEDEFDEFGDVSTDMFSTSSVDVDSLLSGYETSSVVNDESTNMFGESVDSDIKDESTNMFGSDDSIIPDSDDSDNESDSDSDSDSDEPEFDMGDFNSFISDDTSNDEFDDSDLVTLADMDFERAEEDDSGDDIIAALSSAVANNQTEMSRSLNNVFSDFDSKSFEDSESDSEELSSFFSSGDFEEVSEMTDKDIQDLGEDLDESEKSDEVTLNLF